MRTSATIAFVVSLLGAAGLSACDGRAPLLSATGSNRACLADNPGFGDAWACVRARLAAREGGDGRRDGLIEEGDILAGQVKAGKVSDAEARRRLSAGLQHEAGD